MSHLPALVNETLEPLERRRLGYLWAVRAVRDHAHAALDEAGYRSLAHHVRGVADVASRGGARRLALYCAWVGAQTLVQAGIMSFTSDFDGKATARALYTLLDAAQASLVAAAVASPGDLQMVGDRVVSAASTAPWRQDSLAGTPGSRAWAAGAQATAEAAADDERRSQREELKFAYELSKGGPGRHLADRTETLADLAA